ncbi:MAG: nitrogen fixation protein AnfA [Bacteroidota bacterium]
MVLLFEVSQRLISSREIRNDLRGILKLVTEHLSAEKSFFTIWNRHSNSIFIEDAYGMTSSEQARGKYQFGEGVIGRVVEMQRPVVISEISKSQLFMNKTRGELTKDGAELSLICVPLIENQRVAGALSVIRVFNPEISYEEDIRLLSIIGSMVTKTARNRQDKSEELELLKLKNKELQEELESSKRSVNIVGNSAKILDVLQLVKMVGRTNSTVLIRGESGIGKELFAEAIHKASPRAEKPLIKVNCSALPDSLIESELFGHEKGAFTGADSRRIGRFELANTGTIFLDEIGDLPLQTQVKLLRILQEHEFERLGGSETIKVDIRIVAATNRNLEELIQKGLVREDFFYRINVFPIFAPPLRDRRDDIPLLVDHFIEKFNKRNKTHIKRITTSAINMLMVYSWPGNVRELENVIERACILTADEVVHSYNLPPTLQTADSSNTANTDGLQPAVERLEKQLIREALTSTKGNVTQAANYLNITERMLGTRLQKYNIDAWRFKV